MILIVDTREQLPFSFNKWPEVQVQRAALSTGDYSLLGLEHKIALERKSIDDLVGCLMGQDRERFERELARGTALDRFAVVVEDSFENFSYGRYRSKMKPHAALQSLFAFQIRYGTNFIFAYNRAGAEYTVYSLLQKYLAELEKAYKAMQEAVA